MLIDFITPAEATASFKTFLVGGGIAVMVPMVILSLTPPKPGRPALSFGTRCVMALFFFACVGWVGYSWTLGRFVAAEVSAAGVTLRYTGPFGKDVVLGARQVKDVRFGMDNKRDTWCYIVFERDDSKTYKSAWLEQPSRECKRIRDEILGELKPG